MRYAVETGRALCFSIMTCPFCNAETVQNDTMPWCVACRCEYRPARIVPAPVARAFGSTPRSKRLSTPSPKP